MAPNTPQIIKGECECCDARDVEVTIQHGNMKMCAACVALEATVPAVNAMIASSRAVDDSVKIKTDIFTAKTVAIVELKGAIDNDANIPANMKDYQMAKTCSERYEHFKNVVFSKRQELLEAENEMRAWQINTQEFASKLDKERREHFRQFDINYQPPVVKQTKQSTKTTGGPSKAAIMKEAKEQAAKYGVPIAGVMMIITARNMKPEDAAKQLAKSMGLVS